jgi:hypothetical protein
MRLAQMLKRLCVGQGSRPDPHFSQSSHIRSKQIMTTQQTNQVQPLFALGVTLATRGAREAMQQLAVSQFALLSRHQRGDWGNLDKEDKQSNDQALTLGGRIFSAYQLEAAKFWVITEADRSATTILLPEEY